MLQPFKAIESRVKALYVDRTDFCRGMESAVTGDFICTVHSDAVLAPEALGECALFLNNHPDADALYSDEDRMDARNNRFQPFFKPDWSPEYLESFPYLSSLTCYRTSIMRKTGWLEETDKLAIDYDLALRFSELTQKIAHIPKVLYHRYVMEGEGSNHAGTAIDCLKDHLRRVGIGGTVAESPYPGLLDVRYDIAKNPLVSIIIPAGGRKANIRGANTDLLSNCITSIRNKSVYKNYEIIVVHDNNLDRSVLRLIENVKAKLVPFGDKFNFSAKVNLGARHAQGEHLLILNDDTEVISDEWLSAMVEFSQRKAIGAVGAKLYFEDGTIQHAGVTFTRDGSPHHIYHGHPDSLPGYFYSLVASRNCLAVTGACLMTRREVFHEVGGFNEEIPLNYNDVDYCFKVIEAGCRIVFTPRARLFHFESKSRLNIVKQRETNHFKRLWHSKINLDPYYNINLEPNPSFFEVKIGH
jgi:GT2 family glycosyltransferase